MELELKWTWFELIVEQVLMSGWQIIVIEQLNIWSILLCFATSILVKFLDSKTTGKGNIQTKVNGI